jgi:large subunit ribosomal protein L6
MSKIGRTPILISSAKVRVEGNRVFIEGSNKKLVHDVPDEITVCLEDKILKVGVKENIKSNRAMWGLHRALLANKIKGVEVGFEKKVKIVGLGYKASLSGKKITLSLGYTHKIEHELPEEVSLEIDKSGQQLVFKSTDKYLLGFVCDVIRSFRPPEPYKGTGVIREGDVIIRKAGKKKTA